MRELKFRAWCHKDQIMYYGIEMGIQFEDGSEYTFKNFIENKGYHEWQLMQSTGLKDKNKKEIYEGDIFRIEESGSNGEPDEIFYVVITWIKEWCMFGSLIAKSEYQDYIDNGVKALDEPLFWTYTLEDTDSRKHFLCGNIYETPNLLK